jgi:hypothetical protein
MSPVLEQMRSEERLLHLLRAPAGMQALCELVEIDPFSLNDAGRIDYLSALERQAGWLQSLMQSAIVAVAGSCEWSSPAGKKYFVPARPMHETL